MENNNTVTFEQPKKMDISLLVLWIVGWIFCFPIPALIIIWRKKNPWNQATKMLATIALVVLILFASILTVIARGMISYTHNQNIEAEVVEDTVDDSVIEEVVTVRSNLLDEAKKFSRSDGDWQTNVIEKCTLTNTSEIYDCKRLSEAICAAQDSNFFQLTGEPTVIQFDEENILIRCDANRFPSVDKVFPTVVLVRFNPSESNNDFDYELHYCNIGDYEYYNDGVFDDEWDQYRVMKNLKG